MTDLQALKLDIIALLQLSRDAIHMHIGFAVFMAMALITRGRTSVWWAFLAAVLSAVGLEVLDLRDDLASRGYMRWSESLHDVLNTLFWPLILAWLGHVGILRIRPDRPPDDGASIG